jgi:hypothetical protein
VSTDVPSASTTRSEERKSSWAFGLTLFAVTMLAVSGVWQAIAGFSALLHDDVFVTVAGSVYAFDLVVWGWIHLVLGLLAVAAGVAIVVGQTWARVVGIVFAGAGMATNFLFIPQQPYWSLLIIALDAAVIWALSTSARPDFLAGAPTASRHGRAG